MCLDYLHQFNGICLLIDHRRRQNVVRTSVTHSAIALCATFLFLPHFDVICDLLLNRRMATWNLFVKHAQFPSQFISKSIAWSFIGQYWCNCWADRCCLKSVQGPLRGQGPDGFAFSLSQVLSPP